MKVLILGHGGREHALAWKIRSSPECTEVFCHPGNPGIFQDGVSPLGLGRQATAEGLARSCIEKHIDLVVIGPETLLAQGFADVLRHKNLRVVGPDRASAMLETSKAFAKRFMKEFGIPTAAFSVVNSPNELRAFSDGPFPKVLKYDGLAAGKGVVIANSSDDVTRFERSVFENLAFGPAPAGGPTVVVEEFIHGTEVSYIGLCDGTTFIPLETATDFKRVGDNDSGANTGGMGAISPSPIFTPELKEKIDARIVGPILKGLKSRGLSYRGVLFIGLMIDSLGNPHVLEFNVRFGDPETQAVLLRLESDLAVLLDCTARGLLSRIERVDWTPDCSVYVVATAENYPEHPVTGDLIHGMDRIPQTVRLFAAGIDRDSSGVWITAGGRVLGIGATGSHPKMARDKAYAALKTITWRGQHYRTDIARESC